jgi:hypothetical protein
MVIMHCQPKKQEKQHSISGDGGMKAVQGNNRQKRLRKGSFFGPLRSAAAGPMLSSYP